MGHTTKRSSFMVEVTFVNPGQVSGAVKARCRRHYLQALAVLAAGMAGLCGTAAATTIDWSGADSTNNLNWSNGNNWVDSTAPADDLTTDVARFNLVDYTGILPTIEATRSVAGLEIGDGTTATGTFSLTLAPTFTLTLGGSGINMFASAGAATITGNTGVILGAAQTWTNNSVNTLTVSAPITGTAGQAYGLTIDGSGATVLSGNIRSSTGAITKSGTGSLTLSGNNIGTSQDLSFNGNVNLQAGKLIIGHANALGHSAGVFFASPVHKLTAFIN